MFNTKWQQPLCSCNKISHRVSREMYAGSLGWSGASQRRPIALSAVGHHVARTGGSGGAAVLKGSEVLPEASAKPILYKHANLCPTAACGGTCVLRRPVPELHPQMVGCQPYRRKPLEGCRGCDEWVPAHKLLGTDASRNWQK